MTGSRRDAVGSGGDPYRMQGNRSDADVRVEAVVRLLVGRDAAYAIDDVGRTHVLDATGALKSSIETGPFADAALHDDGGSVAIASYGRGVTTIEGGTLARRFVSHSAPVLSCAPSHDGLVVGDQAGEVTRLLPERSGATPFQLRAQILSIAVSGTELAVLTADGELLTGTSSLTPVRGLRAKRAFQVLGRPGGGGFVVLDRDRAISVRGDEVQHTSRDVPEGIRAFAVGQRSAWLLTDAGRVHHFDETLRASAALTLGVSGRPRGLSACGERALVWTSRGELTLVAHDGASRLLVSEGALAAAPDPRTNDAVVALGTRGLSVRRYPTN